MIRIRVLTTITSGFDFAGSRNLSSQCATPKLVWDGLRPMLFFIQEINILLCLLILQIYR